MPGSKKGRLKRDISDRFALYRRTIEIIRTGLLRNTNCNYNEIMGLSDDALVLVAIMPKPRDMDIARLLGEPRKARFVGFALHASPGMAGGVPCHRVVFRDGGLAPGFAFGGPGEQRRMLETEGVTFRDDEHVDMAACLWEACQ